MRKTRQLYFFIQLFKAIGGTIFFCGIFSLPGLPSGLLAAGIEGQFGASARAISMGNSYIALSDDISAAVYNPAGLVTKPRDMFSFSYIYNDPEIKLDGGSFGRERVAFDEKMELPTIGLSFDLGWMFTAINKQMNKLPVIPEPLRPEMGMALGVLAGLPNNLKQLAQVDTLGPDTFQFPVYGRLQDFLILAAGVGLKINKMLYLGASIRTALTMDLTGVDVEIDILKTLDPDLPSNIIDFTEDSALNVNKLLMNIETELMPVVGIILMPVEDLRIGATWRKGGAMLKINGDIKLVPTLGPDIVLPALALTEHQGEWYFPEEVTGSIAYKFFDKLLVAVEGTCALWSGYNLSATQLPPRKAFKDIIIPRLGLEYQLVDDVKIRSGYFYQPSPVKSIQISSHYMDADLHVFSAGLGYVWAYPERFIGHPLELDLYFQYQHLIERTLHIHDDDGYPEESISVSGRHMGYGLTMQVEF